MMSESKFIDILAMSERLKVKGQRLKVKGQRSKVVYSLEFGV
jgi:hypothetical protein